MKALLSKKDFRIDFGDNNKSFELKKNWVYILPDNVVKMLGYMFERDGFKSSLFYDDYQAEEIIKPYNDHEFNKYKIPVIVRSGGIGDILALSSIVSYLSEKARRPMFVCDKRFMSVFSWFLTPPGVVMDHFYGLPIPFGQRLSNEFRLINIDNVISDDPMRNWYEKFFRKMNACFRPEYGRPKLLQDSELKKKSIIIVNRASSNMRSTDVNIIVDAVLKSKCADYEIEVFDRNVLAHDKGNIIILPEMTQKQFLKHLSRSGILISVDTSAIHFYEGLEKPGLGLYASFTSESRTKYYKYTDSVDVKNNCELSPCFLHDRKHNDHCEKMKGENVAPCLSNKAIDLQSNIIGYLNVENKHS